MIDATRPTAAVTKFDMGWNQCGLSNCFYCTARDRCKPRASSVIFSDYTIVLEVHHETEDTRMVLIIFSLFYHVKNT